MVRLNVHYLAISAVFLLYMSGILVASAYNTDFGSINVSIVSIPAGDIKISGLLYRPRLVLGGVSLPAVILVHGISSNKETMSDIALELARNGFVALAIDLKGHGNSEGVFGSTDNDPTLGALAAVNYIESQTYVNRFLIGLVGHSLGAGIVRATARAHENISSVVLIAGGVGEMATGSVYGDLNSTFPKNLLFVIGMEDVLFNLGQLQKDLAPVFGANGEVVAGRLYGSFSSQTARKLITPSTTHLFEPANPTIVNEVTSWIRSSLKNGEDDPNFFLNRELVYGYSDSALTISFIALIGLTLAASLIVFDMSPHISDKKKAKTTHGSLSDWRILAIWGTLGLGLFIPMLSLGSIVSFPPLLFGSSFAWWLFGVGVSGLVLTLLLTKISSIRMDLIRNL
ncbi:MAG: Alpha/beta fold hydrolase [Thermoproteota archaeon]|nr:Alpha/beta fold hydrolase [Thermoproteota archaeon]